MRKVTLILSFSLLLLSCNSKEVLVDSASFSPIDYVNPLVGTLSKFSLSTGNTYPAIALPWGMNFWTPQTGEMGNGWTYSYTDDQIVGFKQTHQPSPWINDYGQFSLMPVTGGKKFLQNERSSWFSHKAETAKPYYYSVYLADHDVKTEITPTERSAYFMFTFPKSEKSYIVVDAFDNGSFIQIDKEHHIITGYTTKNSGGVPENFRNYFVIKFDKPFTTAEVWSGNKIIEGKKEVKGNHVGAILGFKTNRNEKIGVKVSSSFINEEQAWLNLEEIGSKDFNMVKEAARHAWNDAMNKVRVEGGTDEQYRTFYSCLYRSLLFPRKFYEIDKSGSIVHYSPYNGEIKNGYMYTDTGFWDTFRALFPFLNLMYPSVSKEVQESLVNAYKESGFLPEWASPGHRHCMVGNNSASVVADAYLKVLGAYLDKDDVKSIRDDRIINFDGEADKLNVDFLQKPDGDTTQEHLIDRLEKLIFHISMVANISDENFGTSSGIAMKYKLQAMHNLEKTKERKFTSGMNRRYRLIFSNPVSGMKNEDWVKLHYKFTPNIPANVLEETEIAGNLDGIVSQETQLGTLSIVDNVQAEIDKLEEEQKKNQDDAIMRGLFGGAAGDITGVLEKEGVGSAKA